MWQRRRKEQRHKPGSDPNWLAFPLTPASEEYLALACVFDPTVSRDIEACDFAEPWCGRLVRVIQRLDAKAWHDRTLAVELRRMGLGRLVLEAHARSACLVQTGPLVEWHLARVRKAARLRRELAWHNDRLRELSDEAKRVRMEAT